MKKFLTIVLFVFTVGNLSAEYIDLIVNTYMGITPNNKGEFYSKNWYYNKELYKHKLLTDYRIYGERELIERLYWISSYGLRGEYLDKQTEWRDNNFFPKESIGFESLEVSDLFNILHLVTLGVNSKIVKSQDVWHFYTSAEAALNRYNQDDIPNLLAGGEFVRTGNENYSRVVYLTLKHYLERNKIIPTNLDSGVYKDSFIIFDSKKRFPFPKENRSYLGEHLLLRAIEDKDIDRVENVLLEYSPEDNLSFYGISFVQLAASTNNLDITKLLLDTVMIII